MSAHTFRQRDALARAVCLCPKHHAERIASRPAAPWWLWAILIASVAVVLAARIMEVL
jgi:hypothetical protein